SAEQHENDEHSGHNQHGADNHDQQRTLKTFRVPDFLLRFASFFLLTTCRAYLNILGVDLQDRLLGDCGRPQRASAIEKSLRRDTNGNEEKSSEEEKEKVTESRS